MLWKSYKNYKWKDIRDDTNPTQEFLINDKSDLDVYLQRRQKTQKNCWRSCDLIHSVPPRLKYLCHTSHNNLDAMIQRCALLYMYSCIYNQPLLMDYNWGLKHAGVHTDKFTSKQVRYIWQYKNTDWYMEPNNDIVKYFLNWNW